MRTQRRNGHTEWQPDGNEELYRLIAEHSTDMISKHTPEGVYTYASPACRSLLGYEPEDLIGRSAYDFFHHEDLDDIRKLHSTILKLPNVYTVEYRIRRKDGTYTWFETTSKTIRDQAAGDVQEIIAVSRDITERKRTDEALRKSEEFHRFAVEAGRIGTWDLNLQTEECLLSPKMAELMGFSPNQTIVPGLQWREAIVPDDRTLMASALAASIKSDAPFDLEFRVALKDGTERWLYSRAGVTRDASGRPCGCMVPPLTLPSANGQKKTCANPKRVCGGRSKSKRSASFSSEPTAASLMPTTLFSA